jgi:hypothetical protein
MTEHGGFREREAQARMLDEYTMGTESELAVSSTGLERAMRRVRRETSDEPFKEGEIRGRFIMEGGKLRDTIDYLGQ